MTPSLFIACPAYGEHITTHCVYSLMSLGLELPAQGIKVSFGTYSYHDIVRIRNLMLTWWYDQMPGSTHILFVDSDMKFDPYVVRRMIDRNVECVGVVYPKKSPTEGFVGSFLTDVLPRDGFMPVRGLGGGILLIRRDCVTKLLQHDPSMVDLSDPDEVMHGDLLKQMGLQRCITAFDRMKITDKGKRRELGEDLSFCERVREAGMTVWGSVSDPVSHVGWQEFRGCMYPEVRFGPFRAERMTYAADAHR